MHVGEDFENVKVCNEGTNVDAAILALEPVREMTPDVVPHGVEPPRLLWLRVMTREDSVTVRLHMSVRCVNAALESSKP